MTETGNMDNSVNSEDPNNRILRTEDLVKVFKKRKVVKKLLKNPD